MSTLRNIDHWWEFAGEEIPITITYMYSPGSSGLRERGSGLPLEPDEPASVEILHITTPQGERLRADLATELKKHTPELEQEILTYLQEVL